MSTPSRRAIRLRLRSKVILISLLLVFIPLIAVWSIGIYEDLALRQMTGQVRELANLLSQELVKRELTFSNLDKDRDWLTNYAKKNHVMVRLVDAALGGDLATARATHERLFPLMMVNFIESNPIPVKAALAEMGLLQARYRLPLVPPEASARDRITDVLQDLGLLADAPRRASSG